VFPPLLVSMHLLLKSLIWLASLLFWAFMLLLAFLMLLGSACVTSVVFVSLQLLVSLLRLASLPFLSFMLLCSVLLLLGSCSCWNPFSSWCFHCGWRPFCCWHPSYVAGVPIVLECWRFCCSWGPAVVEMVCTHLTYYFSLRNGKRTAHPIVAIVADPAVSAVWVMAGGTK
jgi:hypothetical protein